MSYRADKDLDMLKVLNFQPYEAGKQFVASLASAGSADKLKDDRN
jgi:hypothetical protein